MNAPAETVKALKKQGYVEEEDGQGRPMFTRYRKGRPRRTQQWVWDGEMWERYEIGAVPREGVESDTFHGLPRQLYPHSYKDEYQPSKRYQHPERWNWKWPDADVRKAYR